MVEILGPAQDSGHELSTIDRIEVAMDLVDLILDILATDAEVILSPLSK